MRTRLTVIVLLVLGVSFSNAVEKAVPVPEVPPEFSYVGTYRLVKRVKMRAGKSFEVAIPPVAYLVYSDGISLRFYGETGGTHHTAFDIYRHDGVMRHRKGDVLESVPGVQARSFAGEVLRQVTLTGGTMTLTKFPALSDAVEITYAARVVEADQLEASSSHFKP